MITINFDTTELQQNLQTFAQEVEAKALRPAAFAASDMLYKEMQINAPVRTGLLRSAIYQFYNERKSIDGLHLYSIGVNMRKAPHWHLLEYGTIRMAAKPFIAPTYDAKITLAMEAALKRLGEKLEDIKNGRG